MRSKALAMLTLFLFLIPLSFAIPLEDDLNANAVLKHHFHNETLDNSTINGVGIRGGIDNTFNTTACLTQDSGCFVGQDTKGDRVTWPNFNNREFLQDPANQSFAISTWANVSDSANSRHMFASRHACDRGIGFQINNVDTVVGVVSDGSSLYVVSPISVAHDSWSHYMLSWNGISKNLTLYINGTLVGFDDTAGGGGATVCSNFAVGGAGVGTNDFFGTMQGFYIFNRTLTDEEISYLSNVNNIILPDNPVNDTFPPVVTTLAPTPSNDSFTTNILVDFNFTITDDFGPDTIILDLNGTQETGFVNTHDDVWTLQVNTMAEGTFEWNLFVNDTFGNVFQSGNANFTVDNTTPVIVYTFPSTADDTIARNFGNEMDILGFNVNLIRANLSVFDSSSTLTFQNITESPSNPFTFTDEFPTVFSGDPDDIYTVRACFIDAAGIETCEEHTMTLDNTAPTVTADSQTAVNLTEGNSISFNTTCGDANGLTSVSAQKNTTGSFVEFDLTLTAVNSTLEFTDTADEGTIANQFVCTDVVGNEATSSSLIYNAAAIITLAAVPELPLEGVANLVAMAALFLLIFFCIKIGGGKGK